MNKNSDYLSPDAPLLQLIARPMAEMNPEELRSHLKELREATANGQQLRKQVGGKKTGSKTKKKPSETAKAIKNTEMENSYLKKYTS